MSEVLPAGVPEGTPMGLWPRVEVFPGAVECLASLAGLVPLCIATNATVSRKPLIELALERAGILACFSKIFCYTELGYRKDQLEFWQVVQRTLGVPLECIAMVGDSLEQDVLAPRSFGVQAVWFDDGRRQPSATVPTVTSLEDFAVLVKAAV